uniref:Uncharacterized protein n=1 Tax=Meloidogyne enterolobii TaxID=390850 RepID=A0A6V7TQI5_MELEN|nr:unnamed protein product [Meloidogyne enterolobii]
MAHQYFSEFKIYCAACLLPGSCDFTIWALLSMLDGLQHFSQIECVQKTTNFGSLFHPILPLKHSNVYHLQINLEEFHHK